MSHLRYYAYEGLGVKQRQNFHYSQAVRVGDKIECAGQGESMTLLAVSRDVLLD